MDEGLGTQLLTGKREEIRKVFDMPENVIPTQIQILGYPAEAMDGGGQRPRPEFESLYFEGKWGSSFKRDPKVVQELQQAGMIQPSAPLPWRAQEVRALAGMFGLPE